MTTDWPIRTGLTATLLAEIASITTLTATRAMKLPPVRRREKNVLTGGPCTSTRGGSPGCRPAIAPTESGCQRYDRKLKYLRSLSRMLSKNLPAPSATHSSGFSAKITGTPVSF